MIDLKKVLTTKQLIIIIIIIISILFSFIFSFKQYKLNRDVVNKLDNLQIPNELVFLEKINPNEVDDFQTIIEKDFDWFLDGNFSKNKDVGNADYDFMKNIFNLTSGGVSKGMSESERKEVLQNFSYEFEDFGVKVQENGYKAIFTLNVKSIAHTRKNYLTVDLDKDKKIKKGGFFDEIK